LTNLQFKDLTSTQKQVVQTLFMAIQHIKFKSQQIYFEDVETFCSCRALPREYDFIANIRLMSK
jgi:hypothetical protein